MLQLSRRAFLSSGAAVLALPAAAQEPSGTIDPLAKELLGLVEPGVGVEIREAFWRRRMSEAGQRRWPLEDFQRVLAKIAEQSGGVDYLGSRNVQGQPRLRLWARRPRMERWMRVRMDRKDPDRLFDIGGFPTPAPYDGPAVTGPVSRKDLAAAIEARLSAAHARDEFSGAARIVGPDGAVVYERAFGIADHAVGTLCGPDTRFHLGSSDKSFTAIETMRLVAAGRLTLETTLEQVLPDYPNAAAAREITIRHLLSHCAGLGGLFDRPGWSSLGPTERMADILPVFAAEALAFTPGSRAAYSNEGYVVLGAVIEAVSGESWYDLVARNIHAPAGMSRSGHFRYDRPLVDRAVGYSYADDDILGLAGRKAKPPEGYRGNSCGGGYSTVRDMTAYLSALHGGRILDLDLVGQMTVQNTGGLDAYGLGFQVVPTSGRTCVGHAGGGPHSGIDGDHGLIWETGWAWSIIGNYDAPFAGDVAREVRGWLALQPG